jgi:hypothetical protein
VSAIASARNGQPCFSWRRASGSHSGSGGGAEAAHHVRHRDRDVDALFVAGERHAATMEGGARDGVLRHEHRARDRAGHVLLAHPRPLDEAPEGEPGGVELLPLLIGRRALALRVLHDGAVDGVDVVRDAGEQRPVPRAVRLAPVVAERPPAHDALGERLRVLVRGRSAARRRRAPAG